MMNKYLNDRSWSSFKISSLFHIQRGNAKDISRRNEDGNIALLGARENNNAYLLSVEPRVNETIYKNCITINNNGSVGFSFYHPYEFVASSDVTILTPKQNMSKQSMQFIAIILNKLHYKYSYGYKISNNRIKKQNIMLPVNDDFSPDWLFMDEYINERTKRIISSLLSNCKAEYNKLKSDSIIITNEKSYNAFRFSEVFDFIQRGKRLKKADHIDGTIPYISSTSLNNGVDGFIGNIENVRLFEKNISIANSGSVGSSFYHEYKYVASDHVTALESKYANKYSYLYLATMTSRLSKKYSFNREINNLRIYKEKIILPINNNNQPNWLYMENYIKSIMRKKIKKIIDYYSKKSASVAR